MLDRDGVETTSITVMRNMLLQVRRDVQAN